jgi:hypothetical protein
MKEETLWKNNPNFVKDVLMVYVSFIIIVIIVSEKKVGGITFVPPLICLVFPFSLLQMSFTPSHHPVNHLSYSHSFTFIFDPPEQIVLFSMYNS